MSLFLQFKYTHFRSFAKQKRDFFIFYRIFTAQKKVQVINEALMGVNCLFIFFGEFDFAIMQVGFVTVCRI